MDRAQTPGTSARRLPDRNSWRRQARERTVDLRARLLTGDAQAAQITRGVFHLLHWEHRGQRIFPLPDGQKTPRQGHR